MLDEELAAKLERAIANDNTIVAVNVTDRERIVALLVTRCPSDSANFAAWSSNSSRNNEDEKLEISQFATRRVPEAKPNARRSLPRE